MAQVWQCDRCEAVSKNGNIDDPPDGWIIRDMPVRGSEGARSSMAITLCMECDDRLYEWLHDGPEDADVEHLQSIYEAQRRAHNELARAVHSFLADLRQSDKLPESWKSYEALTKVLHA